MLRSGYFFGIEMPFLKAETKKTEGLNKINYNFRIYFFLDASIIIIVLHYCSV